MIHPETERRVFTTGAFLATFDDDHGLATNKYSLQSAIIMELSIFIDKSLTISRWDCGLNLILGI